MYNIIQYSYNSPIFDRITIPKDYRILGVYNQYSQGSSTGFIPTFNPYLILGVKEVPETLDLVLFSVKAGVGTIQSLEDIKYIGTYSITDDGLYSLWCTEENCS